MILAHLSAGRAVSIEAHDHEIEIDDAAFLAGIAPLEFLESLTQLGLPMRADQDTGRVYIGTADLGQCLSAIHADQPDDLASGNYAGASEDWKKARALLTRRQWPFAERLVHDLRKAGNRIPPETYALDYYFGSRPLLAPGRSPGLLSPTRKHRNVVWRGQSKAPPYSSVLPKKSSRCLLNTCSGMRQIGQS